MLRIPWGGGYGTCERVVADPGAGAARKRTFTRRVSQGHIFLTRRGYWRRGGTEMCTLRSCRWLAVIWSVRHVYHVVYDACLKCTAPEILSVAPSTCPTEQDKAGLDFPLAARAQAAFYRLYGICLVRRAMHCQTQR